jgi:hypothetical protein
MEKRGSAVLWIVIIILILAIAVGSYFIFFNKSDPTCTDTDEGKNYTIKGTAYGIMIGTSEEQEIIEDECITGNEDGNNLKESFCTEEGELSFEFHYCANGCVDGACRQDEMIACLDTDGGKDYYIKGSITDDVHGNYPSDYCHSAKTIEEAEEFGGHDVLESDILFEHYCDEINQDPNGPSNFKWELYECPNGCRDGACI